MKQILYFASLFSCLIAACKQTSKKSETSENAKIDLSTFATKAHSNFGVILTNQLDLYDLHQQKIKTVSGLYGEIVEIDSISADKIDLSKSDDRCKLLNFVKVKSKKINGWVYSPFLYEKELNKDTNRDTSVVSNGKTFKLLTSKNFNIGVSDEEEDGLSMCGGNDSPLLLYNSLYDKYESIEMLSNAEVQSKDHYYNNYLTLDAHDGWYDKIKSVSFDQNKLTLVIYREYQEGSAFITVEIALDKNKSTGKVVHYERILDPETEME